jgi:cation:H+ antiporter
VSILLGLLLFAAGAGLAVWATERLLTGLVRLAALVGLSTFAIGALLSGLEAENIAVGLAAARGGSAELALGSVFGGASFLVCVALGLGAIVAPLKVRLPRGALLLGAATPVAARLALVGGSTERLAGAVLLLAFAGAMLYLLITTRRHEFAIESDEVEEALEERSGPVKAIALTVIGVTLLALGGELVTEGSQRLVTHLGIPALLMGMVIAPATIELDEVVRQVVPAKQGHPEVSAGNLLGTLLYFALCNLGLIALLTPVRVPPLTHTLDWPFLVAATWLATIFLARGRVGRAEGALLLAAYAAYVALHSLLD